MMKRLMPKDNSQRAFVRLADPDSDEASAQGYLSKVLKGKKPPPMHKVGLWADALGLAGAERNFFIELAAIAHVPADYQPRFEKLLRAEYDRARPESADSIRRDVGRAAEETERYTARGKNRPRRA